MKLSHSIKVKEDGSPSEYRGSRQYERIKSMVHLSLVERLELEVVTRLSKDELSVLIRESLEQIIRQDALPLNMNERGPPGFRANP